MGEHDQIEGLLGDLSFATIARGANKTIDHLDQRGGPYNGVELVEHQRFERVELVTKELGGARQPELSFVLMVMFWLRWRGGGAMIMVPCQHEKISDIVRNHGTEFRINRFSVFERDYNVINMRMKRLECVGNGGVVEFCNPVEKQR